MMTDESDKRSRGSQHLVFFLIGKLHFFPSTIVTAVLISTVPYAYGSKVTGSSSSIEGLT